MNSMDLTLRQLLAGLDQLAPFSLTENWDNTGLLVGSPNAVVHSILIGLDPTICLLDEALSSGANTILTHHPIIFHPLSAINTDSPSGRFLEKALKHDISCISCHTNLDNACNGVSDALANGLGLTDLKPLRPGVNATTGAGRIGQLQTPLTAEAFLEQLHTLLGPCAIQIAGTPPSTIRTVALCGGSGSDLAETAHAMGADLYLSAEIKHSTARWAEESGFCVIDGTHFGTEYPVLSVLQASLQAMLTAGGWSIPVRVSQTQKAPFYQLIPHRAAKYIPEETIPASS